MSHFTVMVVSKKNDDLDELMIPYQEEPPKKYLKFCNKEVEINKAWKSGKTEIVVMPDGTYLYTWDEKFRVAGTIGTGRNTHQVPEEYKVAQVPFNKIYKTKDIFVNEYFGYDKDNKMGKYGYWHNPNAKWDFYEIGGRWSGALKLKVGKAVDSAKVSDIDWKGEGMKDFGTFAILKNGKWIEKGEMGWFACVSNEKEPEKWEGELKELLDLLAPDDVVTIVDCHI